MRLIPNVDGHLKALSSSVLKPASAARSVRSTIRHLTLRVHADEGCERLLSAFPPVEPTTSTDEPASLQVRLNRTQLDSVDPSLSAGPHHFRRGLDHAWSCTTPRQVQTLAVSAKSEARLRIDESSLADGAIRARPAVDSISAWAAMHGVFPIHASGIADNQNAVLIVGEGGVGKTTTALSLALSGWGLIADDRCFVSSDGHDLAVSGLYQTAILTSQVAKRFPEFIGKPLGVTHTGKVACQLPVAAPLKLNSTLRGVICLSSEEAVPYRLRRVDIRESLRIFQLALLPTMQAIGPSPALLRTISRLTHSIPVARMSIGWDLNQIDRTMKAYLESISTSDSVR